MLPAPSLLPFGRAQWGRGSTWASRQAGKLAPGAPTAVRSQALSPLPREGALPTPHFSLLGQGPVCRLLRSNPAKRLNQNQLFYACRLPPPATLLSLSCRLFWPSAPGYLLEVGFPRAAWPPRSSIAHPRPLSLSPALVTSGFPSPTPPSQTQKTSSALSSPLPPLC